ncbi:MAG TPA: uracil-DNA glycosylase family protein [Longimicrobiales bacterium]
MIDRELLLRYLRQRRELGERELLLDTLTAAELLARVRGAPDARRRPVVADTPRADFGPGTAPEPRRSPGGPGAGPDAPSGAGRATGGARSAAAPSGNVPGSVAVPGVAGTADAVNPATARGLRVLGQEAAGCTRCRLHEGRRNVVFGEGSPVADLVVVGEAPGAEEDRTGRPFVGPAGQLLDLLLLTIGLPRERVYICNVLKCRPPNNRDPMGDEVEACSSYLHRQLDLITPRVLLAVGKFAAQTLTGAEVSIGRLRGRVHEYRGTPVIATYHPAYLLRSPSRVRAVWADFQLVREVLDR